MPMRGKILFVVAPLLMLLLAVTELGVGGFIDTFRTGVLIGSALVVLLLYPALLHQHERRLAALETRADQDAGAAE